MNVRYRLTSAARQFITRYAAFIPLTLGPAMLAAQADPHLLPKPREVAAGTFAPISGIIAISSGASAEDRFAAKDLAESLRERGLRVASGSSGGFTIQLLRASTAEAKSLLAANKQEFTAEQTPEGYVIVTTGRSAHVIGATAEGIFYGAQTMKQLVQGSAEKPTVFTSVIRDWPAMKYRGIQDDLSRGPLPTLEFQKKQIRTFAAYKLNVYSPYYEHTMEYKSNPLIGPPGGTMSQADIKAIVAYAKQYHIDVIPEQEAFGHLHHILKYDLYSAIGETEHGHVLAPGDPRSIPLIKQWFAEIDSLFPSKFVHIGADETFELGMGRTKERVKSQGIGTVYLDFLKQVEEVLRPSGKKLLFWGDVAQNHPDLVKSLPKDMVAVAWDYWTTRNFRRSMAPYVDAGLELWVAPGNNSWSHVYPNNDLALRNIQGFIREGQQVGATGVLNTTWDDDGEAIFNQGWYGILFGAAASWQKGESSIPEFAASFGQQFHGDPTGKIDEAQRKLSQAHVVIQNGKAGDGNDYLFWLDPWSREGRLVADSLRPYHRQYRILAESAMVLIAEAREANTLRNTDALDAMAMGARRMDFIGMKFQLADEMARYYLHAYDTVQVGGNPGHDLQEISSNINARTQDLRDGYVLTGELYEQSWRAENRPYWLRNVMNRFDLAAQLWIQRGDDVKAANKMYARTKKLPTPEEMGIPRIAAPKFVP
jgi:hexosaminidase